MIKVSLCFSELLTQIWVTATPSDEQLSINITGRTLRALFLFPFYRWRACAWEIARKLCQREKSKHSQRLSSSPEEDGSLWLVAREFSLHDSHLISSKSPGSRVSSVPGKAWMHGCPLNVLEKAQDKKSQKTTKLHHFLQLGQAPVS